jgi:hypothetical protein
LRLLDGELSLQLLLGCIGDERYWQWRGGGRCRKRNRRRYCHARQEDGDSREHIQ